MISFGKGCISQFDSGTGVGLISFLIPTFSIPLEKFHSSRRCNLARSIFSDGCVCEIKPLPLSRRSSRGCQSAVTIARDLYCAQIRIELWQDASFWQDTSRAEPTLLHSFVARGETTEHLKLFLSWYSLDHCDKPPQNGSWAHIFSFWKYLSTWSKKHHPHQVYIDLFDTIDESLKATLQRDCEKFDTGIEIIAVRVTKPRIPDVSRRYYFHVYLVSMMGFDLCNPFVFVFDGPSLSHSWCVIITIPAF